MTFSSVLGEDGCQNGDDRKKRPRTAFTASQIKALETEFEKNKYLSVSKRMQLSKHLKLTETQVNFKPWLYLHTKQLCVFTMNCRSRYGFKTAEPNGNESTRMTWRSWLSSTILTLVWGCWPLDRCLLVTDYGKNILTLLTTSTFKHICFAFYNPNKLFKHIP